ncbi:DUF2971 domain-containing protein [Gottfriedia acidiceleris]|uniref:DUF2971 domain-containing protein n=1 Tax=Gottfriedia acidiceleris TaxID=371036 RepID=UPI002F2664FA
MDSYFGDIIYTDDFMWEKLEIYELPKFLYHYTSIENLALILKNNTIRFSRLDGVNDMNEAMALNLPNANTAIFNSSWTSESSESIPMWKMYTKDMEGVRIKLPINMFKGRDEPRVFEKGGSRLSHTDSITIDRVNLNYSFTSGSILGPNKIYYTDDEKYLYSKVLNQDEQNIRINLYDLGMFKKKSWEFEQEWRFKILALHEEVYLPNDEYTKMILDLETYPIIQKYIDINLEPDIFNEAEITLGPKASEAQYIILNALIEKFAPQAKIHRSNLQIR